MLKQKNNNDQQKSLEKRKKKTWSTSVALGSLSLAIAASAALTSYFINQKEVLTTNNEANQMPQVAEKDAQAKPRNLEQSKQQADDQIIPETKNTKDPLLNRGRKDDALKNKIRSELYKYLSHPEKQRTSNDSRTNLTIAAPAKTKNLKGKTGSKNLADKSMKSNQTEGTVITSQKISANPTKNTITKTKSVPQTSQVGNIENLNASLAAEHVVKKANNADEKSVDTEIDIETLVRQSRDALENLNFCISALEKKIANISQNVEVIRKQLGNACPPKPKSLKTSSQHSPDLNLYDNWLKYAQSLVDDLNCLDSPPAEIKDALEAHTQKLEKAMYTYELDYSYWNILDNLKPAPASRAAASEVTSSGAPTTSNAVPIVTRVIFEEIPEDKDIRDKLFDSMRKRRGKLRKTITEDEQPKPEIESNDPHTNLLASMRKRSFGKNLTRNVRLAMKPTYERVYQILSEEMLYKLNVTDEDDISTYIKWVSLYYGNQKDSLNQFYAEINQILKKPQATKENELLILAAETQAFFKNSFTKKVQALQTKKFPGYEQISFNQSDDETSQEKLKNSWLTIQLKSKNANTDENLTLSSSIDIALEAINAAHTAQKSADEDDDWDDDDINTDQAEKSLEHSLQNVKEQVQIALWKLQIKLINNIDLGGKKYDLDTDVPEIKIITNSSNAPTALYGLIKENSNIVGFVLQNNNVILLASVIPTESLLAKEIAITHTVGNNQCQLTISGKKYNGLIYNISNTKISKNQFDEFSQKAYESIIIEALIAPIFKTCETNSDIINQGIHALKFLSTFDQDLANKFIQMLRKFDPNIDQKLNKINNPSNIPSVFIEIMPKLKDMLSHVDSQSLSKAGEIRTQLLKQLPEDLLKSENLPHLIELATYVQNSEDNNAFYRIMKQLYLDKQLHLPLPIRNIDDCSKMLYDDTAVTITDDTVAAVATQLIDTLTARYALMLLQKHDQNNVKLCKINEYVRNNTLTEALKTALITGSYNSETLLPIRCRQFIIEGEDNSLKNLCLQNPKCKKELDAFILKITPIINQYVKTCYVYDLTLKDNQSFAIAVWGAMKNEIGSNIPSPNAQHSFTQLQAQLLLNQFDLKKEHFISQNASTAPTSALERLHMKLKKVPTKSAATSSIDVDSIVACIDKLTEARKNAISAKKNALSQLLPEHVTEDTLDKLSTDDMKFYLEHTNIANLDAFKGFLTLYYKDYTTTTTYSDEKIQQIISELSKVLGLECKNNTSSSELNTANEEVIIEDDILDPEFVITTSTAGNIDEKKDEQEASFVSIDESFDSDPQEEGTLTLIDDESDTEVPKEEASFTSIDEVPDAVFQKETSFSSITEEEEKDDASVSIDEDFDVNMQEEEGTLTSIDDESDIEAPLTSIDDESDIEAPKEEAPLTSIDDESDIEAPKEEFLTSIDDESDIEAPKGAPLTSIDDESDIEAPKEASLFSLDELSDLDIEEENAIVSIDENFDVNMQEEEEGTLVAIDEDPDAETQEEGSITLMDSDSETEGVYDEESSTDKLSSFDSTDITESMDFNDDEIQSEKQLVSSDVSEDLSKKKHSKMI